MRIFDYNDLKERKKEFPVGSRIKLVWTVDESLETDAKGTVVRTNQKADLEIAWDSGQTSWIIHGRDVIERL